MISPDEKFRPRERLLKSRDFNKVYKKAIAGRSGGVILYSLPNGLEYNRLGFSIGAKNIKRAVSRNRIRRLFKEAYRKTKNSLLRGFDIVIVVRREPSEKPTYDSVKALFMRLVKDVNMVGRV